MHTKAKGNVGELAIAKDLTLRGYSVFAELGDLSRIDLIAVKEERLTRVQVKTVWDSSDGVVGISSRSSGPGYSYNYTSRDVDIIALYIADRDDIIYVDIHDVDGSAEGRRGRVLRYTLPKNNQSKGVVMVNEHKRINASLI
jgi:hypothetical protein